MNSENNHTQNTSTTPRPWQHRPTMAGAGRIAAWVIGGLALACIVALAFGLLVQWLWSVTLTPMFGLARPSYWQAVGLIILGKLLFGGIAHHHKEPHPHSRHSGGASRFEGRFSRHRPATGQDGSDKPHGTYFKAFWNEEGKKAFANYLARQRGSADVD